MNPFYADLLNTSFYETDSLIVTNLILPNLDPNSVPVIDSDNIVTDVTLNNGELLIGRNGNTPVANTLTGTTNQVNVTNASGSITLSTPQDIAPSSSPTFNDITVNNINGKVANDLVIGPSGSVDSNVVIWDGTTGDIIKDSGIPSSSIIGGPFLKLDGTSAMNGDINLNTNELINVSKINNKTADALVTSASLGSTNMLLSYIGTSRAVQSSNLLFTDIITSYSIGATGNIPVYSSASKTVQNSGISSTNLVTSQTIGATGMVPIYSSASKEIQNSGISSTNLVTSQTIGATGMVPIYSSASKEIQSSGILSTDLVTTTALANKVSKTGDSMSGTLNMTGSNISNVGSLTTSAASFTMGFSNTVSGGGSISIGANNTGGGSFKSILMGSNNSIASSPNGQSIIYGSDNTDSNSAGGSFIYGFSNTNNNGQRNIIIGRNNTVSSGTNDAYVIGYNGTNSTSNSILLGNPSIANIRPNSSVCSLGTSGTRFVDCHLSGSLVGTSKTSAVNSIVTGPTGAGNNNLCIFDSTTGNIIKDSGRPLADLVTIDGGSILFGILSSSMNIWARGQPCVLSKLTQHTSVTVTNTTTATAVFTAGGSVGGTIYTNNSTQVGTVIKVRAWFQINNWAGGGTLSIRLDVNSVAYGTLTIPSPPTGNYFKVEFDLTVRPSNLCRINGVALLSGGNNVFVDSGNTWNVASSYGLNVTVQWSVASGSNTVSGLTGSIETHYQQ